MKGYNKIRKEALRILNTRLPEELHYHGAAHTLNVLKVCNQYIRREKIPLHSAKLLRIAALLHDIGFSEISTEHETRSAEMAEEMMTRLRFSNKDIWIVKRLILSTKIPQSPNNYLEKVICDADLDYLGRDDFKEISDKLYQELKVTSPDFTKDEWNRKQIAFLKKHTYHTEYARKYRQPKKEATWNYSAWWQISPVDNFIHIHFPYTLQTKPVLWFILLFNAIKAGWQG